MKEFIPIAVYMNCMWRTFSWFDFYNVVMNLIRLAEANFQTASIS